MPGRISRNRGYNHEHHLETVINNVPDWECRRLGGSSAKMPDLLMVNNHESIIISAECKSLMSKRTGLVSLYVPLDQIQRCITMCDMFKVYRTREVILVFKFGRGYKNSFGFTVPFQYWFEILNAISGITSCDNKGNARMRIITADEIELRVLLRPRISVLYEEQPQFQIDIVW